ncbi:MAG: hypothetical protein KDA21_15390 [Phycisphaerales bacterium]|nr:hypothetical protein [Phycisphaerales bacterium]
MILTRKDARRLAGNTGATDAGRVDYGNHIANPILQAYAFNAIDGWPEEAADLLRRCGLPIDLALETVPAALLAHVLTGRPHGLHGDDLEAAAMFWPFVESFQPATWSDARRWLIVALRSRVLSWLPVLLEHFAAELRRCPSKVASIEDCLVALLALFRLSGPKGGSDDV